MGNLLSDICVRRRGVSFLYGTSTLISVEQPGEEKKRITNILAEFAAVDDEIPNFIQFHRMTKLGTLFYVAFAISSTSMYHK